MQTSRNQTPEDKITVCFDFQCQSVDREHLGALPWLLGHRGTKETFIV